MAKTARLVTIPKRRLYARIVNDVYFPVAWQSAATPINRKIMNQTAETIADWFLSKAIECGEVLTPMKLLKLVYIAHGCSLGSSGVPLFPDVVQAWRWGPVIPSLYHKFKIYGSSAIDLKPNKPAVSSAVDDLLCAVWNAYGGKTALSLSSLTHMPGTPWSETFSTDQNNEIPAGLIAKHYSELLNSK